MSKQIYYRGFVEHNETIYLRGYPFIGGEGGTLIELNAAPMDSRTPSELALTSPIDEVFAEIAKLREENQRLRDQRDVAIADYRIALNELDAIIAWVDGPEMQRYNTSIARMILKGAKQ